MAFSRRSGSIMKVSRLGPKRQLSRSSNFSKGHSTNKPRRRGNYGRIGLGGLVFRLRIHAVSSRRSEVRGRAPRPQPLGLRSLREMDHPRPGSAAVKGRPFFCRLRLPTRRSASAFGLDQSVARAGAGARIGSRSTLSAASTRAKPETRAVVARALRHTSVALSASPSELRRWSTSWHLGLAMACHPHPPCFRCFSAFCFDEVTKNIARNRECRSRLRCRQNRRLSHLWLLEGLQAYALTCHCFLSTLLRPVFKLQRSLMTTAITQLKFMVSSGFLEGRGIQGCVQRSTGCSCWVSTAELH